MYKLLYSKLQLYIPVAWCLSTDYVHYLVPSLFLIDFFLHNLSQVETVWEQEMHKVPKRRKLLEDLLWQAVVGGGVVECSDNADKCHSC